MTERTFNIHGERCISCDLTCRSNLADSPALWTSRLPALGIKIIDHGIIRGDGTDSFVTVCLEGENKPYLQAEPKRPDLKQSNKAPRICLNHLPTGLVIFETGSNQEFKHTILPVRG